MDGLNGCSASAQLGYTHQVAVDSRLFLRGRSGESREYLDPVEVVESKAQPGVGITEVEGGRTVIDKAQTGTDTEEMKGRWGIGGRSRIIRRRRDRRSKEV